MKKLLLAFLLLIFSLNMKAQHVFTTCADHPVFGDSLMGVFDECDTTGFTPGSAGANVIWNYANLTAIYTWPLAHYYLNPSTTEGIYMFPNANVADKDENGVYSYLVYSQDSVSFSGDYRDSIDFHGSWDTEKKSICPMSYGDSFSDFFSRYNFSQCPYHHTYTNRTVTYDSYGTLNLPLASYNVARIKIVENTLDTAICLGPVMISNTVDTNYIWYDINTLQPVLSFNYFSDSGNAYKNTLVYQYKYSHIPAIASGVKEENDEVLVNTYPNPAKGKFVVELGAKVAQRALELSVYNLLGERIFSSMTQGGKMSVDISSQPDGIYFLKVRGLDGIVTRKIVIAK